MPEGPTIVSAAEQLARFRGKQVQTVEGNTKAGKERLVGQKLADVFSYGKYLNFQFPTFAMRTHFMLWGSYSVDEPRPNRQPRLVLRFKRGAIYFYACSVQF